MHLLPLRIKEYVVGSEQLVKISTIRRFANVSPLSIRSKPSWLPAVWELIGWWPIKPTSATINNDATGHLLFLLRQETNPTERPKWQSPEWRIFGAAPVDLRRLEKRRCISRTLGSSFRGRAEQFIVLDARHRFVWHREFLVTLVHLRSTSSN